MACSGTALLLLLQYFVGLEWASVKKAELIATVLSEIISK
jgi:hypothetical protein